MNGRNKCGGFVVVHLKCYILPICCRTTPSKLRRFSCWIDQSDTKSYDTRKFSQLIISINSLKFLTSFKNQKFIRSWHLHYNSLVHFNITWIKKLQIPSSSSLQLLQLNRSERRFQYSPTFCNQLMEPNRSKWYVRNVLSKHNPLTYFRPTNNRTHNILLVFNILR